MYYYVGHTPWNKGKKMSKEYCRKLSKVHKGQKLSKETRLKLSLAKQGKNHPNWKGGITTKNRLLRESTQYKQWRRDIFIRDEFTCQKCGHRFIKIVAHHIKSFVDYPDLRFDINNGKTYCRACHCRIHKPVLRR